MAQTSVHPALNLLLCGRWSDAFGWLHNQSEEIIGAERARRLLDKCGDRQVIQDEIRETVDALYALGTHAAGELALAWSMLACRPNYPTSFRAVLPRLQYVLDAADLQADDIDARERLRIWWAAGAGGYIKEKRSMFAVTVAVLAGEIMKESALESPAHEVDVAKWFRSACPGPTLTVLPATKATKLNQYNKQFSEILDKPLPLVCARNLDDARKRLSYEFPHASAALSVLFKDLREGEPVRLKPTILLGPPGAGKSRVVRKWAVAVGLQHVQRVDAASVTDGHFGGASKIWSNTEASVPARAILASRTANPLVFIDEIDKCTRPGSSSSSGSLMTSLAGFCDKETAKTYRDQSLDCELNLSEILYLCTANDVTVLPDFLRDRFRIVRVPAPRLVDLPLLAASIMEDLAREDAERVGDEPLAPDELMVIAKAWEKAGFSLRKLQAIVRATLEARDAHAMRH
ncbi:ATPase family associated with various cellular activities (AAA) [Bradyrhizobium sp. Rc2d]|uniref:AAA family ATPase n=1 Tax=Bradyrhizobium sp. Rc2d TaxID=1855321 RepID=UPI00087E35C5|nr:AAA family ATPase [Bradyrhizobium sp. Rc2d]SDJ74233.1 ATPase family associated with various cellular activities (AAA) [Bradyrhizobium sp. Rc2d]